jgi:hypothetical protein
MSWARGITAMGSRDVTAERGHGQWSDEPYAMLPSARHRVERKDTSPLAPGGEKTMIFNTGDVRKPSPKQASPDIFMI